MKQFAQFYPIYVYLLLVVQIHIFSCKGPEQSNKNQKHISSTSLDTSLTLSTYKTIYAPNAPSRITRKIKLDQEGNLLIASYEGIIRYNGDTFSNLTKENGLLECYAFDVMEDKNGNIWIASNREGVYLLNTKTREITNYTTKDGLGHMQNMCIYEDEDGYVWIGGSGGLSKYNPSAKQAGKKPFINYTTEEGMPHNDVNTIMSDKAGNIWFGTRGNAGVFNEKGFTEIKNADGKSFFNVWSITEDRRGNIWLADTLGLWLINAELPYNRGNSFTKKSSDIWGVYEDSKGNFWCTNMPRFGPATLSRIDADKIMNDQIQAVKVFQTGQVFLGMVEDRNGNIWIGGGDGVWCYNGKTVKYYTGVSEKKND